MNAILRRFFLEFKDGLVASLQGFFVLHKLDCSDSHQTNENRRPSADSNVRMTVLEKRRNQRNAGRRAESTEPKRTPQKLPIRKRLFWCALINMIPVLVILGLSWFVDWLDFFPVYMRDFGSKLVLIPVLIIRCLSTLWFADVANAALRYRKLSSGGGATRTIDFSRAASDFLHAIIVEFVFLIEIFIVQWLDVPVFSKLMASLGMCLLNSLYSFDYIWMAYGALMHTRLAHMDNRWAFHFGFGVPLTIATSLSSSFAINGLVFGAIFPIFIISSCLVESSQTSDDASYELQRIPFFYTAQVITNKISVAIFSRFYDDTRQVS